MPLATGTRLGPYQILSQIGEGGMGEVYRARDTRLGRDVAMKVLPQHLALRPEARARFEREAKAVSSLNHPHICTLYDVGREGDTDYIVMEMIEGETLAHRLLGGALPTAEVLRFGAQIADALGRAHRAGVVHRDLKPGNVMLTKSGAKLMDFGLAKGIGSPSSPSTITALPTATSPLTAEGSIVGTLQYMAPEQLEGKEADERSDLFALGTVLYEMATGKRAFEGKTPASLLVAILKEDPRPIRSMDAMSPPALDRLVRQCLRKDPDERIQSAHDVRLQLEVFAEAGSSQEESPIAAVVGRNRLRERLAWGIAALATLLAMVPVFRSPARPAAIPPVLVSSILPPEESSLVPGILGMALSPDGRLIAYIASGVTGTGLWVRALESSKPTLLVAVDDADCPFWSPDSRSVGFRSGGSLRKVDVADGQSVVLAPMRECLGAFWGSDGSILYVPGRFSPIMKVPETGGEPVIVTSPHTANIKRIYSQPSLLPDREHLLYTVNESWQGGKDSGVYVARTGGEDERRLLPVLSNARFLEPGYLVYAKEGSLRAHRFDPSRLELIGEPITLVEGVQYLGMAQSHAFSFSDNGLLAYAPGKGTLTGLTWVDRKGVVLGTVGRPGNYFSPRISHDGKRIAYDQSDATTLSGDIWVVDLDRGIPTRLTFDPQNESAPIWSPDDARLLFYRDISGRSDLFTIPSDGTGQPETVLSNGSTNVPCDWSGVAKSIVLQVSANRWMGVTDLLLYSTENKKTEAWLDTPFVQREARFSPDGRWISYDSDESGRMEVYVRGLSPAGGKWRVSSDGGGFSVWSRDGRELFYLTPDSRVMSVAIRQGATFEGGTPVPLFRIPGEILNIGLATQYDVFPDGRRFLMNLGTPTQGEKSISLVSNWTSLLRQH